MEQIQIVYGLPKETVITVMMLKNHESNGSLTQLGH